MQYRDESPAFNPEKAEQRRAEVARALPVTEGDAAFLYLTQVRGIPAATVLGAVDIRLLPAPISGRPPTDYACVSLLRPGYGTDETGAELAFVDILGRPSATEPRRISWAFQENGCRNSWFLAGGNYDGTIVCVEGFCAKPLALLAAGVPGRIYGWGSRSWLRYKELLPPVKRLTIIPDRAPLGEALAEDRKRHEADYRRVIDHWLLSLGEDRVFLAPDPGEFGKDSDEILRTHGPEALRALAAKAAPAALSGDGWSTKLGRMSDLDYDRRRKEFAAELGIRLATLDGMRKAGSAEADSDECVEDNAARSRLIAIAVEHDLFQDDGGDAYCAVEAADGAIRTYKVEGAAFADLLLAEYGRRYPTRVGDREIPGSVNATARIDALRSIAAFARQGETRAVFLRLGWSADRLYLDMGTPEPRAIEITPSGWTIIQGPPVHLVFSPTAKPLPIPAPGSRKAVLRQLRRFFGFQLNDDRLSLLIGVMLAGLLPRGPYPILILSGEQGSGKTTRSRFIKIAIDPTKASVRGRPRSAEDLAISVWRSWIAVFDNLSKLDQDMSDWLCRLSEGAGLPKRKLYTDSEEILIEAARPIMLTAIPDIAQSGDVIDRAVLIRCDPLPTKVREQVLLDQFEAFRPQLLGYLVEAAACALRRYGEMTDTQDGLRRGDWAAWVEAAAPALGLPEGAFTAAYRRNQDQAVQMAVELDAAGAAIVEYMADKYEVETTASLLHQALEQIVRQRHDGRIPLGWSSGTNHFSGRLRRLAPMLRRIGIEVEQAHGRDGTTIWLINPANTSSRDRAEKVRKRSSRSSRSSQNDAAAVGGDGRDDRDDQKQAFSARAREKGNGAAPNHVVDEVPAGTRCGYCGCKPVKPTKHGRKTYCGDACLQEVLAREARERAAAASSAEPPPTAKRSRIKRPPRPEAEG